jgi:hypothetical protein
LAALIMGGPLAQLRLPRDPTAFRRSGVRALWLGLGFCLGLALTASAAPPTQSVPEYSAKAYSLLLFSRYVDWPTDKFPDAAAPVIIGVLGANPFGEVLEQTVSGQRSQNRPVEIRLVRTAEEAARCHIVFICRLEARSQSAWLGRLRDLPVLTVAETEDALEQGAVIRFAMEQKASGAKLRFDASLPAMQRAGLHISAPMLVSARLVQREPKEDR